LQFLTLIDTVVDIPLILMLHWQTTLAWIAY